MIARFVFAEYTPDVRSLGLYRIIFSLFALLYLLPEYLWISDYPDSFFNPPLGIAAFVSGFPPAVFFHALNVLLITCAVCMLFGYHTVAASVAFASLIFTGNSWSYAFGKINHDLLLALAAILLMAFAGWGGAYSIDVRRGRDTVVRPWAVSLLALIVALAMFTAAYSKIMGGWLDPSMHSTLGHLIQNVYAADRQSALASLTLSLKSELFWEAFDVSTIVIEAAFLAVVMNRRAFSIVCAVACLFHVGVALLMKINFTGNLLAYAAFVPWATVIHIPRVTNWIATRRLRHLMIGSAAVSLVYLSLGNPLKAYSSLVGMWVCVAAASIACFFLTQQLFPRPTYAHPVTSKLESV